MPAAIGGEVTEMSETAIFPPRPAIYLLKDEEQEQEQGGEVEEQQR